MSMFRARHSNSVKSPGTGSDLLRIVWGIFFSLLLVALACGNGITGFVSGASPTVEARKVDWQKVFYQCISKVEQSDATFYRRGERLTGKQLARQMREYLNIVLKAKSVPDPFGRNVGILLSMITTNEGIARDGLTGTAVPFEVELGGKRMKVYDWLKQELGLERLPGEERGHEALVQLYDAVLHPDLLREWEEYLAKCIEVTKRAGDCKFYLAGKYFSAAEAASIFASNQVRALQRLKEPDIKHPDEKDLYNYRTVLLALTRLPLPQPESFPDRTEYVEELNRWIRTSWKNQVEHGGTQEELIDWLLHKAGEPPPMPKLKKKGKGSG